MHPTWDIPEIVELIFDFLSIRDAAMVAAVRRTFWRTALPYIWREIDTFDNLLLLLPDDALSKDDDDGIAPFALKRRLHESDWGRFLMYSRYTKKLSVILSEETLKDYLPVLAIPPTAPLLPNLTSIQFEISRISEEHRLETLSLFPPQTISEVRIEVTAKTGAEFSAGQFLQALREEITPLPLKSFAIEGFIYPTPYSRRGVSELLLSHHGIQSLDISIGSGPQILGFIHSVGELPHLRHFRSITFMREKHLERAPCILFPSLETLGIRGSLSFICPVLDCVGSRHMQNVQAFVSDSCHGDDLEAYATVLSRCLSSVERFTGLKTFDLELTTPISVRLLDRLCKCESLEALRLVGVDPGPLETRENRPTWMTTTWPRLTKLELKPTFDHV